MKEIGIKQIQEIVERKSDTIVLNECYQTGSKGVENGFLDVGDTEFKKDECVKIQLGNKTENMYDTELYLVDRKGYLMLWRRKK